MGDRRNPYPSFSVLFFPPPFTSATQAVDGLSLVATLLLIVLVYMKKRPSTLNTSTIVTANRDRTSRKLLRPLFGGL